MLERFKKKNWKKKKEKSVEFRVEKLIKKKR